MSIAYDSDDDKLMNYLINSEFKMQYIHKIKNNEEEDEEKKVKEDDNITEEMVKFDHEFVFDENCGFRLYIKNELLFRNDRWILYQGDTINLSEFCYNELS